VFPEWLLDKPTVFSTLSAFGGTEIFMLWDWKCWSADGDITDDLALLEDEFLLRTSNTAAANTF
jgi:hypothetical protein